MVTALFWLWLTAFVGLLLTGCGFQLRGWATDEPPLPSVMWVEEVSREANRPPHPLVQTLRQTFEQSGVVMNAQRPEQRLRLLNIEQRRRTVAFNPAGSIRETELTLEVDYEVRDAAGEEILPLKRYRLTRNAVFNEAQVLGATEGEATVIRQMEQDAATAILRQLQALKR